MLEGTSTVDDSMITGESIPAEKNLGGELIGAMLNDTGSTVAAYLVPVVVLAAVSTFVASSVSDLSPG